MGGRANTAKGTGGRQTPLVHGLARLPQLSITVAAFSVRLFCFQLFLAFMLSLVSVAPFPPPPVIVSACASFTAGPAGMLDYLVSRWILFRKSSMGNPLVPAFFSSSPREV